MDKTERLTLSLFIPTNSRYISFSHVSVKVPCETLTAICFHFSPSNPVLISSNRLLQHAVNPMIPYYFCLTQLTVFIMKKNKKKYSVLKYIYILLPVIFILQCRSRLLSRSFHCPSPEGLSLTFLRVWVSGDELFCLF